MEAAARHRHVVATALFLVVLAGVVAVFTTPVDALPDTSDTQVIVVTDVPGQDPQVVDDQVTYPLSTALLAVPGARTVRGFSSFGTSMVYVLFDDGTDPYWARARVSETLDAGGASLPPGTTPRLGPDASGVGWVYQYVVRDAGPESRALRAALDADHDGVVTDSEIPPPQSFTVLGRTTRCTVSLAGWCLHEVQEGGRGVAVYTPDRVDAWLRDGGRPGQREVLVQAFDRDHDGALSRAELGVAARFEGMHLGELRDLQDHWIGTDLAALRDVAQIATVGGFKPQLLVEVDPDRLEGFGLTLQDAARAVQAANGQVGGGVMEVAETEWMIRADGLARTPDDLAATPLAADGRTHTPVRLDQVARIHWAPAPRRGATDWNGEGDAVSGIVVMRSGANALDVIDRVTERLADLGSSLPPGVVLQTAYDRGPLVRRAVDTLTHRLVEELVIVALVCGLLLGSWRAALVPAITLPLGVLGAAIGMRAIGLRADVMSLGGIALAMGVMVDAAVVMVENVHRRAEHHPDEDPIERVVAACAEVGPAIAWSLVIVTLAFVPVFALEQAEGRLFRPLAWTKTLSMAAATAVAVFAMPALLVPVARERVRPEADHPVSRLLIAVYTPILDATLRRPRTVIAGALLVAATALWPWSNLPSEYMPPLDEGDLLYMPTTPPGLSITKARALLQQTDRLIAAHPQVATVLGKAGRADTATDPAPLSMFETVIQLTPRDTWPPGKTVQDVIRELDDRVAIPGLTDAWTMPIRARLDMLSTGIRTPVGIKLLGDDLDVLAQLAREIEGVVGELDGVSSVYGERVTGGHYVDIDVDREAASRWGLTVAQVHAVVQMAIGGTTVGTSLDGLTRHDIVVRYPRELRHDLDALRRVRVPTPMGHAVLLEQVATLTTTNGPPGIKREAGRRTAWIHVDLDTADLGGWVDRAKRVVRERVSLPAGVTLVWSGQYDALERARNRLAWLVPATLALILVLLQLHFRALAPAAMLLGATILFAPVGGLWFVHLAGWPWSVAVAVGFIALLGLAAETGVVMMVYLDDAWATAQAEGRDTLEGLTEAAREGAVGRLRPKVLTVATTVLALLPILVADGTGSRVMRRIAAPMVGGLASSAVLTLIVLPALWFLWRRTQVRAAAHDGG